MYERVAAHLVGRERELTLVLAAVAAGRDIVLEGPPGTSKSTLLRAITAEWGIPLVFVEGNADLTPSKLIGHHNPAVAAGRAARHLGRDGRRTRPRAGPPRPRAAAPDRRLHRRRPRPGSG